MKVIVAIDDSPHSVELINSVVSRKWPANVEFKILTVIEPICNCFDDSAAANFSETIAEINLSRKKAVQTMNEKIWHKLEKHIPGAAIHCETRLGIPRIEIINAAGEWQADRILLGSHGYDVCPHNIMGSVSRAVVNHAPCSVEVVRSATRPARSAKKMTAANKNHS